MSSDEVANDDSPTSGWLTPNSWVASMPPAFSFRTSEVSRIIEQARAEERAAHDAFRKNRDRVLKQGPRQRQRDAAQYREPIVRQMVKNAKTHINRTGSDCGFMSDWRTA